MSIVFVFSWDLCKSQEKLETMLMQNLGGQTKNIMVFSEVAYRWFSRYVIAAMLVDEKKRFLISSFCSSTSNCTLQHCYLCPWRLVANHLLVWLHIVKQPFNSISSGTRSCLVRCKKPNRRDAREADHAMITTTPRIFQPKARKANRLRVYRIPDSLLKMGTDSTPQIPPPRWTVRAEEILSGTLVKYLCVSFEQFSNDCRK